MDSGGVLEVYHVRLCAYGKQSSSSQTSDQHSIYQPARPLLAIDARSFATDFGKSRRILSDHLVLISRTWVNEEARDAH